MITTLLSVLMLSSPMEREKTVLIGLFLGVHLFCHQEPNIEVLDSRVRLHGHKDAITCIEVCKAFSIVVSGSCDSTAIIWDLNRLVKSI